MRSRNGERDGLIEQLVQLKHKHWLFRNSRVHYNKLEGLTEEQHKQIVNKVKDLMSTDLTELLPNHQ